MLILGHAGITLGIAVALRGVLSRGDSARNETDGKTRSPVNPASGVSSSQDGSRLARVSSLISNMDMRFLLLGSLLPDIIDKPVGNYFFRESLSNGRIFSHTLLFLILITAAGLFLYRVRVKTYLLAASFGVLTHLIFDYMWRVPRTLFWPIYGFAFGRLELTDWIPDMLHALFRDPSTYLPELLGTLVLAWFALTLVRKRRIIYFLRYGMAG